MTSQKLENLLNLALDSTEEERKRSWNLDVGYDRLEREWDLIVKYSGDLGRVRNIAVRVTELQNEYAVIRIAESKIEDLTEITEVEYVEKPKRLFFQVANGKRVSCINEVQDTRFSLFGQGILIGIIDSGIDYANADFRDADGNTRIRFLWDQSLNPEPGESAPKGYEIGVEYTSEQIDEALQENSVTERMKRVRSRDVSGHGTAVTGVAAGNGGNSNGRYAGVATESELLVVKLGTPDVEGFPRTTELMLALDYVIRKALELRMPAAVNLSFGNTYGSHDGTSLVERYIDDMSNMWKSVICVGTGNEAASAGHTSGMLQENTETVIELAVQENQPALNVQIWKEYTDVVEISVIAPSGLRSTQIAEILGTQRFTLGQTELLIYYGKPSPYSTAQEIYIDFLPVNRFVGSGVWKIIIQPVKVVNGLYELWLSGDIALNRGTGFLKPEATTTLTIPSTAGRVISVGAYNGTTFSYADFSGRGPLRRGGGIVEKPDLVAPGVDVTTVTTGGGYAAFTGTSFATPFVTGAAALLMEWGIVKGNDPYLYGEKVKAYLRRGAKPLPGYEERPNAESGYGRLCVTESLP